MPKEQTHVVEDFEAIDAKRCSCGWARRAFGNVPGAPLSLHTVDIQLDAKTHYHRDHTEVYYFLETGPDAQMELDGEVIPVKAGMSVMIPPGVRHRAIGEMRILNVVTPPYDPADEFYD